MAYTDIADNSIITLAKVKIYLRIDSDDTASDTVLSIFLAAAKEDADGYCQDTFTDVPYGIEEWILETVLLKWERRSPFLTNNEQRDIGKTTWTFNVDDYFHGLKRYRREVGFN